MTALVPQSVTTAGLGLNGYLQQVFSIPELSEQQEKSLVKRLRDHNDLSAAKTLVLAHLRQVVLVSKQYKGYGLSEEDLIQEGNVGLMKAVKRFNPDRGLRLRNYASYWIRAEILDFIVKRWRIVKVATTRQKRKLFFKLRQEKHKLAWLNAEEAQQLGARLGVDASDVLTMDRYMYQSDAAIVPGTPKHQEYEIDSEELIDLNAGPAEVCERIETNLASKQALSSALKALDSRSLAIIQRRWLIDQKDTLQQLATEFGLSAERVRQIESQALNKMRQHIEPTIGNSISSSFSN